MDSILEIWASRKTQVIQIHIIERKFQDFVCINPIIIYLENAKNATVSNQSKIVSSSDNFFHLFAENLSYE